VDDPVVAGDAIKRSMAQGQPREVASWLGPTKLAGAILFATITNIVAYLPFLMLSGNTGSFLRSLPIVMATTLISSRVVSMTFIPMLGYYLLRPETGHLSLEERKRKGLSGRYYRVAGRSFDKRGRFFALSLLVLVVGFGIGSRLPTSFFPEEVEYLSYIDVFLPTATPVARTNEVAEQVESIVRRVAHGYSKKEAGSGDGNEVLKSVTSFVGGGGPRFWSTFTPQLTQSNYAELLLEVYDKDFTPELVEPLQKAISAEVPGAVVQVRQLQTNPVAYPIAVEISGRASLSADDEAGDIGTLHTLSEKVKAILRSAPGVGNVYDDWMSEGFEVAIEVDPVRANEAGVTNADVAQSVAAAVSGSQVGTILKGDDQIPIVARLTLDERGSLSDLESLYIYSSQNSNKVPLLEVAELKYGLAEQRIWRHDQFRTITAIAYPRSGVLASTVLNSVLADLEELESSFPPGFRMELAGERAQQQDGFQQLSLIMLISIIGIFVTLVIQFGSTVKPVLVFAAVPYGIAGALIALSVMDTPFGFMAFLGISSLVGVIVSHVIVLFDFVEETQEAGEPLREGLLDAGLERLRPVMITVGATVLALVPLALHGGPLWQPLCYAQIGGLSLATFIELLLVPILYAIFVLDLKVVKWKGAASEEAAGV
jgi:multidrug efflux pump subunit AcrB